MPRASRIPAILKPDQRYSHLKRVRAANAPRLWNAKRRIKGSQGLNYQQYQAYKQNPLRSNWRKEVSTDVLEWVEKTKPPIEERAKLLRSPAKYFSRPYNVPVHFRKQIFFPRHTVTFMRTPHLPPKFAAFDVPLHFNKLDMKDYLKSLYNVEVNHVRSTIVQQKVTRRQGANKWSRGALYRPKSTKKMTVELVEPFVWPEEVDDLTPWENERYWQQADESAESMREMSAEYPLRPNEKHRKSIAEQAKDLLAGKAKWQPTWQSIPIDAHVMRGTYTAPPPPPLASPPSIRP